MGDAISRTIVVSTADLSGNSMKAFQKPVNGRQRVHFTCYTGIAALRKVLADSAKDADAR